MHKKADDFFSKLFNDKHVQDMLDKSGLDAWYYAGLFEYWVHRFINIFEKDERWS